MNTPTLQSMALALREIYDAFYWLDNKTDAQFEAIDKACTILKYFPMEDKPWPPKK